MANKLKTVTSRILEASVQIAQDKPEGADFLHSVMCQVGLPRSKVQERSFSRKSGGVHIKVEAGDLWDGKKLVPMPLPYGTKPRLALIHISSEAVRTQSKMIDAGNSIHAFLKRIGLSTDGRGYAMFKNQMSALASCNLTIGANFYDNKNRETAKTLRVQPVEQFHAWLHPTGKQKAFWNGELVLTESFYQTLIQHAVPLDKRALKALAHSALALDCYTWMAHRLCRINRPKVFLTWANLREQFGQEYTNHQNFKKAFMQSMGSALAVYPQAHVQFVNRGLELRPSAPPLERTKVFIER
tara:strand:- start:1945 stop:2841 length:897 start_codon:yes stop_codon:yes gene_type:complete